MNMIEIKAYIRRSKVDSVVHELKSIGVKTISIILVEGVGSLADPAKSQLSIDYVTNYSTICKLELVCLKKDLDIIVDRIKNLAKTGDHGDGIIFVSFIDRAIKIRTGEESSFVLDILKTNDE